MGSLSVGESFALIESAGSSPRRVIDIPAHDFSNWQNSVPPVSGGLALNTRRWNVFLSTVFGDVSVWAPTLSF